jgi:hypothetical protein
MGSFRGGRASASRTRGWPPQQGQPCFEARPCLESQGGGGEEEEACGREEVAAAEADGEPPLPALAWIFHTGGGTGAVWNLRFPPVSIESGRRKDHLS